MVPRLGRLGSAATVARRIIPVCLLVASMLASSAFADTVVLKSGERYSGSVSNKRILHLNPLSLAKITITDGNGPNGRFDMISFDARQVEKIIVESEGARNVINLEELRQQDYEASKPRDDFAPEPDDAAGEVLQVDGDEENPWGVGGAPEDDIWRRETHTEIGKVMLATGVLSLGIGAIVKFGKDENVPEGNEPDKEYNGFNYVLIVGGAALAAAGLIKIARDRRGRRFSWVELERGAIGDVLVCARWRL
jgi:hypothetical protein